MNDEIATLALTDQQTKRVSTARARLALHRHVLHALEHALDDLERFAERVCGQVGPSTNEGA
jgi:uncharacterized protein YigA (DUF484 family)